MRAVLCLFLVVAVAATGCSSSASRTYNSGSSSLTSDQRVVRGNAERVIELADRSEVKGEGAALGAVAGAALGALLGLAIGGDGKSAAIGAGAGALAGGIGGYAAGSIIAARQEEYANQEAYLNALTSMANEEIQANRAAASAAQRLAQAHRQRIEELNRLYQQKQITRQAYRQEYADMALDGQAIQVAIESNRQNLAKLQQEAARTGDSELMRQKRTLEEENRKLEQALANLVGSLQTVPSDVQA